MYFVRFNIRLLKINRLCDRGKAVETVEDYIEREHFTDRLHPTSVICPVNVFTNAMSRRWMSVADRYNYTVPDSPASQYIYTELERPDLSLTRVAVPPSPPPSTIFPPPPAARFSFRFAARKTIHRRSIRE